VIPNGITMPARSSRINHGGERERKILFLSRIHPKKGLLDLVEAWARVKRPGWCVVVAGPDEGGFAATIKAAAARAGVNDSMVFVGAVTGEKKEKFFLDADVFVLPSYSENFGIVVGEALSYGVPVIATNVTPWEELHTWKCGWWIDTGVTALAAALTDACAVGDIQRSEMGARGRRLIGEKYSWRSAAEAHLAFYEWLLHGGGRPGSLLD